MKSRCYQPKNKGYHLYGGRGICIVEEWRTSPDAFICWAIAHGWKKGLQIDRIDNDGYYGPNNCRIATPVQNARNSRRATLLTAFGETKPLTAWAEDSRCRIRVKSLRTRIRAGWTHEEAIATPPRFTRRRH